MIKNLHIAQVKDNNDPDKKGFVKIYIPYMHFEIKEEFLPWALPFQNFLGGSITSGLSAIPEKNSYVWVFFEDERIHKNPFYVGNVVNQDINIANLFEDNIKSKIGSQSSYPNNKFLITDNGICIGFSTEVGKPEVWVYHPSASIFIKSTGEIEIKGGTTSVESMVLGETLKTWLEAHTHPTGVGPSGPPTEAATLSTILSPKIKNN